MRAECVGPGGGASSPRVKRGGRRAGAGSRSVGAWGAVLGAHGRAASRGAARDVCGGAGGWWCGSVPARVSAVIRASARVCVVALTSRAGT